jgi:predicted transposase/invertase (TIGR01784 family)
MTSKKSDRTSQETEPGSDGAPKKVFSLLNDFVFKYVFGQEKNEELAICLLNALLKKSGRDKIVSLEFLNPFSFKEAAELKTSVVDVKVRDGENRCYTIEVQVCRERFFVPRTVYYLAKLYSEQLRSGENYFELRPATGISILDFDLFKDCDEMHNIFEFRNQNNSLSLPETMILHYIELTKFSRNKPRRLCTPFEKWLQVLKFSEKYITMSELPDYLCEEEGVAMAVAQLKKLNADREMRQILEAREKEAHHLASIKKAAHDEGERKKQIEIATKLLKKSLPVSLIAETTGLTELELREILKLHPDEIKQ